MICGLTQPKRGTFEAHITIEPVEGDRLDLFNKLARDYYFKVASLYMIKDRKITEQRSNRDTFCTGWDDTLEDIEIRTRHLVNTLKDNGFKVWRYKIEETLVDMRFVYNEETGDQIQQSQV